MDTGSFSLTHRFLAKTLILALALQSFPLEIHAQTVSEPTRSAIVGFRSENSAREDQLRKVLSKQVSSSDFRVLDSASIDRKLQNYTPSKKDPKMLAKIASAYEHYNAGIEYYSKLDLTNALKEFNSAVKGYRQGISLLRDNYYLLFSELYLGITLHFLGKEKEGKNRIREMVRFDSKRGSRTLPPRDFPPKIVQLHKQVTQSVLSGPSTTVTIESIPSGAKVVFDGSEVGKTPIRLKKVPAGQHFVVFEMSGYHLERAPIDIGSTPKRFKQVLKEKKLFQARSGERTSSTKEELAQVASLLNADVLILGQVQTIPSGQVQVKSQVFDTRSKSLSKVHQEIVDARKLRLQTTPKKLRQMGLASNTEKKSLRRRPPLTQRTDPLPQSREFSEFQEEPDRRVKSEKSILKKWWFWAIVGGVAVGGGVGAALLLKSSDAESNFVNINNPLNP